MLYRTLWALSSLSGTTEPGHVSSDHAYSVHCQSRGADLSEEISYFAGLTEQWNWRWKILNFELCIACWYSFDTFEQVGCAASGKVNAN